MNLADGCGVVFGAQRAVWFVSSYLLVSAWLYHTLFPT